MATAATDAVRHGLYLLSWLFIVVGGGAAFWLGSRDVVRLSHVSTNVRESETKGDRTHTTAPTRVATSS